MPGDHGLYRITQAPSVKRAGHGELELDRIQIVFARLRGVGVEQQALLQRGQRQNLGDLVLPL